MSHLILVVDDDPSVRASTLRVLAVRGYQTIEAATASEALLKASQALPDAILMDLHLQGASGIQAARQLKSDPALQHIPIIALSATPAAADATGLFVEVLRKPCPSQEIVSAIESAIAS